MVAKVSPRERFDNGRDLMGERESRDTSGTARSLNVVHYIERDMVAAARLVVGLVERSATAEGTPSLLAVLPTTDDVFSLSQSVLAHRRGASAALTPLTAAGRARRVLAAGPTAIAGTPSLLGRLISESGLVLTHVHTLLLIWPEEIIESEDQRALLESVIAELPRSAERVAVCTRRTPELAQFLERTMWRARELDHAVPATASSGVALRALVAPPAERVHALRSVLDAFDPESAVLVALTEDGEAAARNTAAIFGSSGALLEVSRGIPERHYRLGVFLDEVPSAEILTGTAAAVDELVAIVRPSRLTALQRVAATTAPMTWTGAMGNARTANDALRDEIRGYAGSGAHTPWIPIIEPLLEELDPVEVAATALALLDRERRKSRRVQPALPPAPAVERAQREERTEGFRPRPPRREDRGDRPERGFAKKRPWGARDDARKRDDAPRRGSRPDREDRPPRDDRGSRGPRRRDDIERSPRAAREGREWTERGERLKNSRRGPRGGDTG
jgi:hypothetical protein